MLISSCSTKNHIYDYYDSNPIFTHAYKKLDNKEDVKYFKTLHKQTEFLDNNLNYKLIRTLFSKQSNLNKESFLALDLIGRLTKSNLYLDSTPNLTRRINYHKHYFIRVKVDSIPNKSQLPTAFTKFIPNTSKPFKLDWIESSSSYNYVNKTLEYYKFQKKYHREKHYCRTKKVFSVESTSFPNKFYFPKDYVSSQFLCPSYIDDHLDFVNFTREEFLKEKFYLTLNLPNLLEIPVLTNYKSLNSILRENFDKEEEDKAKSLKEFYDNNLDKYQFVFSKTKLLLEPSFKSYNKNIRYVWDLYLLKLNYQTLGDTFKLSDRDIYTSLKFIIPQIQLPTTQGGFYHNNQYFKIRSYLEKDFFAQQGIYKSYFELILWKMYECSEFTLNRKKSERASFTFTSRNPEYPGSYEVFFNIYAPYEFKVKKK